MDNKLLLHIFQQVINDIDHEVFVKDLDGKYLLTNHYSQQRAVAMGLLPNVDSSFIGKHDSELFEQYVVDKFGGYDQEVMDTQEEVVHQETVVVSKDVTKHFISRKKPVYDFDNQMIGVLGHYIELTDIDINGNEVHLTSRELDCLAGVFYGMTAKEIASRFSISHRTVEEYIKQVKAKFNCPSRSELLAMAIENKFDSILKHRLPAEPDAQASDDSETD